jgi:hypothetical protein
MHGTPDHPDPMRGQHLASRPTGYVNKEWSIMQSRISLGQALRGKLARSQLVLSSQVLACSSSSAHTHINWNASPDAMKPVLQAGPARLLTNIRLVEGHNGAGIHCPALLSRLCCHTKAQRDITHGVDDDLRMSGSNA